MQNSNRAEMQKPDKQNLPDSSSYSFQMKVHSSKRSSAHSHHPLPKSESTVPSVGELVVHKRDNEAQDDDSNRGPSDHRLVRALDDVDTISKRVFCVSVRQHAALELFGQTSVPEQVVRGRVGAT